MIVEITPDQVAERLRNQEPPIIVDVREPAEWAAGHIKGSKHIPIGQLFLRAAELDASREMIVVCRSGNRSRLACELLNGKGFKTANMIGGLIHWPDPELLTAE